MSGLVISDAQMAVFAAAADAALLSAVALHLLSHYQGRPGVPAGADLRERTAEAIALGRGRGLQHWASLAAYVTLTFIVGEGFDQVPNLHTWKQAGVDERDAAFMQEVALTTDSQWMQFRADLLAQKQVGA